MIQNIFKKKIIFNLFEIRYKKQFFEKNITKILIKFLKKNQIKKKNIILFFLHFFYLHFSFLHFSFLLFLLF